jgi:peptide/nickel transport system permease protein
MSEPVRPRSNLGAFFATLGRSRAAMIGLAIVAVVVLLAIAAPHLAPFDPLKTNLRARLQPPNAAHWLGTDLLGRDILSRLLYGARLSLLLGLGAVTIGAVSGSLVGLIVGYLGGWWENVVMRLTDIILAFRLLLFAITIIAILGPSLTNTMLAIGASLFADFARLARSETLAAKNREYVEAARALGVSRWRIMFRYILPNILAPLIVLATVMLGVAILSEASLSFLGLGPSPPTPSWGLMIFENLPHIRESWWASTIPGSAIMLVVLGFNLLGDGLRDALDPRVRGHG